MLGKTEGKRRRGWQRRRWLECITNSTGSLELVYSKSRPVIFLPSAPLSALGLLGFQELNGHLPLPFLAQTTSAYSIGTHYQILSLDLFSLLDTSLAPIVLCIY